MIMTGTNITAKDDPLQKIKVDYLYHKIKNPSPEIEAQIRQLRIVRQLDNKQYATLKRQLPYIVCAIFNPTNRKTDCFAYTEYFLIDIDHIEEKEMSIAALRAKLQNDQRVMMCFVSPSQDGLKIMFHLKERCYDAGIYSLFYKLFAQKFASEYSLEQVVDFRTSDVARACFISTDPEIYYNPSAEVVDLNAYVNTDNVSEMFLQKKELERANTVAFESIRAEKNPVDDQALAHIKALLNPGLKQVLQKSEAYVPPQLEEIMDGLKTYIEQANVTVKEISKIQYGKKIQMQAGFKQAEINLFFGKRGFSVVQSPRRGTHAELNQLMADLITQYVMSL